MIKSRREIENWGKLNDALRGYTVAEANPILEGAYPDGVRFIFLSPDKKEAVEILIMLHELLEYGVSNIDLDKIDLLKGYVGKINL